MVVVPKQMKTYCSNCKHHTAGKVSLQKKGKENPTRQGVRRYTNKQKGYHGQTKPILRRKAKNTKKVCIKIKCSQCSKNSIQTRKRAKQVVISNEKKVKGESLVY